MGGGVGKILHINNRLAVHNSSFDIPELFDLLTVFMDSSTKMLHKWHVEEDKEDWMDEIEHEDNHYYLFEMYNIVDKMHRSYIVIN